VCERESERVCADHCVNTVQCMCMYLVYVHTHMNMDILSPLDIIPVVAGAVSCTAAAPMSRIRLLLQTQGELVRNGVLERPYRGIIDCVRRTIRHDGVRALWRGNIAHILKVCVPTTTVSFAAAEAMRPYIGGQVTAESHGYAALLGANLLRGTIAGGVSLGLVYNIDYVYTRLATDIKPLNNKAVVGARRFLNIRDVYRQTWNTDGIKGFHRGFLMSIAGIMLYRGLYFGLFDFAKPILLDEHSSILSTFALGYGVTLTAGTAAYPMNVAVRRMMLTSAGGKPYRGGIDCLLYILKQEGIRGWYRGGFFTILTGLFGAAALATFDQAKARIAQRRNNNA
jgi:solute carrier family 25 (mitochondrial adenine nucleotide translocator), member 4/5/6/31